MMISEHNYTDNNHSDIYNTYNDNNDDDGGRSK